MIEQAIYFGLGCAAAGLLALAFLPVLWARAVRLTRQRLQMQIPVSMQEILADRDHLRASFAVEQRKLEQQMERVRAGKAQDMSEIGRRTAEIVALSESLATLHATGTLREGEVAKLLRDLEEAHAETGALQVALHDAHVYFEQRLHGYEALRRDYHALEATAEERRLTVASLHTRTMGLEMTVQDAQRARAGLEKKLEAVRLRDEAEVVAPGAVACADDPAARIRQLEAELQASAQDAREREKGIHLQRSLQAERVRGESRAGLQKVEALQAEVAALRGALEGVRKAGGEPETGGDAQLRSAIHDIGLAVAAMAADAPTRGTTLGLEAAKMLPRAETPRLA